MNINEIEQIYEQELIDSQTMFGQAYKALALISKDKKLRKFFQENDPKAYQQIELARKRVVLEYSHRDRDNRMMRVILNSIPFSREYFPENYFISPTRIQETLKKLIVNYGEVISERNSAHENLDALRKALNTIKQFLL